MYNSLSNIQKHLYSLIQQNHPEYLQQSINEEYRSKKKNYAILGGEKPENPNDFEGMDQQAAEQLRAKRKAGERMRDREAGYKVKADGETETDVAGNKVEDPELIKKYQEKAKTKDENTQAYYNKVLEGLPTDPTKYTEKQAADVAMMKVIYNTTSKKKNADGSDPNNALNRDTNKGKGAMERLTSTLSNDTLANLSGVNKNQNNPSPSSQSHIALRYQKKAKENALPLGERPISPFYKTTRNQFQSEFNRDFDASGGSNTSNMVALVNNQNKVATTSVDKNSDPYGLLARKYALDMGLSGKDVNQKLTF